MKIVHHPNYDAVSVNDAHRFPMRKYTYLARHLEDEGLVSNANPFIAPEPASFDHMASAHHPDYVRAVYDLTVDRARERMIGFEITEAVTRRSRLSCAGTLLAARIALDEGIACNAAGGSHHAKREGGAGFCVFNDVGMAISVLLSEGVIKRAMVIDCDVHQGDGTADIFTSNQDVFTLSVHCEKNWPYQKIPGTMDLGLDVDLEDDAYLLALDATLSEALSSFEPDIVFYNAGVDPHKDDRLGKLALSDHGIRSRDGMVLDRVRSKGLALVGVIGGGYSRDFDHLARLHGSLFNSAQAFL